ncbi:MAG TPA: hypothetical protein VF469_06970 [Kofleriaceae bacterium]
MRKSLATTNPIESTFSTVRRVSRQVTRWQSGTMVLLWALAGTMAAEKTWRRLMGKADMPKFVTALRCLDPARAAPMGPGAPRRPICAWTSTGTRVVSRSSS